MSISKTKSGSFRVRKKYPKDIVNLLELSSTSYDKIFPTRKEAKQAELDFENRIISLRENQEKTYSKSPKDVLFKDFFEGAYWSDYKDGLTSSHPTSPTAATIKNTEDIFRLHLLPMFGKYSLTYLNEHKQFVVKEMNKKAKEYANFKSVRSYFTQVMDLAEEYDYIDYNRLTKPLRKIKSSKKNQLKKLKKEEEKYLCERDLLLWFAAVEKDYADELLNIQEYTLFWTTFFLSDRKSESYALQWKHVDLTENYIYITQALDRYGNVKGTKGNKKSVLMIPPQLKRVLLEWKKYQKKELFQFGIKQNDDQFLFSYTNRKGEINQRLHTDYLNRRLQVIQNRHPELTKCTPHKLRHTSATLAKLKGMSLEKISEGLTHSEITTTKIYINDSGVIELTPASFAYDEIMNTTAN
ncbi:site-specific integrase [Enterococcus raffinosus]|uniref:site-specific integrase n=1 Tax=Enterococcus raffinosus TaxID=71452 RepID=UPI002891AF10|nr:site-specific integrase [Enterococcus raffinosus]MDT2556643.1 site-specific integrase [Enterococcus raffinosus]